MDKHGIVDDDPSTTPQQTEEERSKYWHALYQQAGDVLFDLPESTGGLMEEKARKGLLIAMDALYTLVERPNASRQDWYDSFDGAFDEVDWVHDYPVTNFDDDDSPSDRDQESV